MLTRARGPFCFQRNPNLETPSDDNASPVAVSCAAVDVSVAAKYTAVVNRRNEKRVPEPHRSFAQSLRERITVSSFVHGAGVLEGLIS